MTIQETMRLVKKAFKKEGWEWEKTVKHEVSRYLHFFKDIPGRFETLETGEKIHIPARHYEEIVRVSDHRAPYYGNREDREVITFDRRGNERSQEEIEAIIQEWF